MMLPSLVPMLWRYRQAVGRTGETRPGRLTVLVGAGYFFVWTVFGMAAFPLGVALATVEMQLPALARAVPIAVGVAVLIAGSLQFTDKIAGNTQPQRRSAGGSHSIGLGSFRFRIYCIHMGICLVFARFLSITFQRLALR
jgi:hypothetical protein